MIRFPPPPPFCSRNVILLRGNGHRPDKSHFLRPPKLGLEGHFKVRFPPPPQNRTTRFAPLCEFPIFRDTFRHYFALFRLKICYCSWPPKRKSAELWPREDGTMHLPSLDAKSRCPQNSISVHNIWVANLHPVGRGQTWGKSRNSPEKSSKPPLSPYAWNRCNVANRRFCRETVPILVQTGSFSAFWRYKN